MTADARTTLIAVPSSNEALNQIANALKESERLELELSRAREERAALTVERNRLANEIEGVVKRFDRLERELARTREELAAITAERDQMVKATVDLAERLKRSAPKIVTSARH